GPTQSHDAQSDCFRTAAAHLQCEKLEIEESARVRAAIAFTLCELATARGHSPPMECSAFAKPGPGVEPPLKKLYACVEALQRSVQFWTTYSGYLQRICQYTALFPRWPVPTNPCSPSLRRFPCRFGNRYVMILFPRSKLLTTMYGVRHSEELLRKRDYGEVGAARASESA
ncbi:hypothetical protein AURDEDRAFT_61571, partial [Auricularia subglabra TFB-10046 SS5]